MADRSCPHCARRLPYAGRRCVHCGWTAESKELPRGAGIEWWRRTWIWLIAVGVLSGLSASIAMQNAPAVADWYAHFAAEHLWGGASSFAPTDTEAGAFLYCARQVSREIGSRNSVETYPSRTESTTEPLGEGRYRIEAFVEAADAAGASVRHGFVCTVRFDGGRWVLEDLEMKQYAGAPPSELRIAAERE